MSEPIEEVEEEDVFENDDDELDPSRVVHLKRGGVQVSTACGTIQFGMPPETIKDSMLLGVPIPRIFVVPPERFNRRLGPNEGINIAEFEFPAYAAFFFTGGNAKVQLIVSNNEVEERIRTVMQETLLGPKEIDIESDFADDFPRDNMPDLRKELDYFGVFMNKKLTVDGLLDFNIFDKKGRTTITGKVPEPGEDGSVGDAPMVQIQHSNGEYTVYENGKIVAVVDENVKLPLPDSVPRFETSFRPPLFGVTILGNSHGFNPVGNTSGYVVWVNRRGIMVDPPPHSTSILQRQCIPPSLIDGVIITHCHADHDAGTFQKILREGRVTLMTTPTIMYSFLRKYAALSGLDLEFLRGVFHYRAVSIGQPIKIRGGRFEFFYTLHSIPCIGFSVHFGGKSMVFSADHMNDPIAINKLYEQGVVSSGRRDVLLNFPWDHDIILHEAGIPPIHTPMDTLVALPEEVKKKLYVVHSDQNKIPEGSGLKLAKEGVQNTLSLQVVRPRYSDAIEILDVISSIDLFSKLSLTHGREVLQIAKREKYAIGDVINTHKAWSEKFYVVAAGVVEARIMKEDEDDQSMSGEHRGSIGGSGFGGGHLSSQSSKKLKSFHSMEEGAEKGGNGDNGGDGSDGGDGEKKTSGEEGDEYRVQQRYVTGDYFGEEGVLNLPPRKVNFVATQKATIIEFEKPDFQWLLEGTKIMERMLHLIEMRKDNIVSIIRENSVLCHLTLSQITQFEEYLFRYEVKKGTFIWNKGDKANRAFIVESGSVKFDAPIPRSRRPSEMTTNRSNSQELAAALKEALTKDTLGQTPASNGDKVEQIESKVQKRPSRTAPKTLSRSNTASGTTGRADDSFRVPPLARGAFIADTDSLLGGTESSVGVVAAEDSTLLMIDRKDLIIFFSNNPGVLLATVHSHYVY